MYLYIRTADRFPVHVSVRSILSLRFFAAVVCLLVIGCFGLSIYDDDLTDNNDLPGCGLQTLLFAVIVCVAAMWQSTGPAFCRGAQAAYRIPRSPPLLLRG